ncbi:MAG: 50S ribosomal protein L30 [Ruminococcaceae bacterium]|nr:50S ribosomal protein L30 [Oscillospiraceae bacterium]
MNVKITLIKSTIAAKPAHKLTAESLGLKKIGDFIVLENTDSVKGKIRAISHLVKVEENA